MKSVLSYLFIFNLLLVSINVSAQTYSIKGKVTERDSGNPMEFANIALLNPNDSSLITGAMSELDGTFFFESEKGDFLLRVGFRG
jgi:iron complex outermembrane recepter protein